MWSDIVFSTAAGGKDKLQQQDDDDEESPLLKAGQRAPVPSWSHLVGRFLGLALPSIVAGGLYFVQVLANNAFVGNTGSEAQLAGVALGNTMQGCTVLVFCFGICGAMDTLVSQAFGAGNHERCCQHLQTARALMALQFLWIAPLLWFSSAILVAIGQDPAVALHAQQYNRAALGGLVAFSQYEAMRRFLMNRNCTLVPAAIGLVTFFLHLCWLVLFVVRCGMGNAGAGYANVVTWWLQLLLLTLYLYVVAPAMKLERADILWAQLPCANDVWRYARVAAAATVQVGTDFWYFELLVVSVGYMGPVALAGYAATCNVYGVPLEAMLAMQGAAASLVGQELGAGRAAAAGRAAQVSVVTAMLVWSVAALAIFTFRSTLATSMSRSSEVQAVMQRLLNIYVVAGFPDCAQIVLNGVLRGLGLQDLGAKILAVVYYLLGLPFCYLLAFGLHLQVDGVPLASMAANMLATVILIAAVKNAQWQALETTNDEPGGPKRNL